MCRLLGYVGPPATLEQLLIEPPHSLLHQSWAPREQQHGTVNADGFGVGWYDLDRRPQPARYRQARPMWTDRSFASLAGLTASGAVLAAVRSATPPAPTEESGTQPFFHDRWLFAHNGLIEGFRGERGVHLRRSLSPARDAALEGVADSEVLFGLVLDRLETGEASPGEALAAVVDEVQAGGTARLNLVLHDGRSIHATVCGETLCVLSGRGMAGGGVVVASEPSDDGPGWEPVPDGSLLTATADGYDIRPMP